MAVAQIRLRRQAARENRDTPLKMWLFPWLSYLTVAAITAVLLAMALTPSLQSQFWSSMVSVVVALAIYALIAARRSRASAQQDA